MIMRANMLECLRELDEYRYDQISQKGKLRDTIVMSGDRIQ